jgi:site-specific recombinase XerD
VLDRLLDKIHAQDLLGKSYVEQYLRHKYRRNCKANTLRQAAISLEKFLSFFANRGNTVLEQLSREDIEAFVEALQDRGLKPTTVNTRLRNVYAFVRYLILEYTGFDWGLMERKVKLKLPDRLPRAFDPQHLDQLLCAIDDCRDRALILLLLRTGMRIGELLNCKLQDIDLNEQKVLIYQSDKTAVGRSVYYSSDAQRALLAWLRVRDPLKQHLFCGRGDNPLCYETARSIFKRCLQKAGLQYSGYTLHCLRHSFATGLLNAKMPLECLRVLLGHSNLEITRRYARLTDKTREEEYFTAMEHILKGDVDEHH